MVLGDRFRQGIKHTEMSEKATNNGHRMSSYFRPGQSSHLLVLGRGDLVRMQFPYKIWPRRVNTVALFVHIAFVRFILVDCQKCRL